MGALQEFPLPKPVLLLGQNVLEAEEILDHVRSRATESGVESVETYYGDEIGWSELAAELSTGSLFGNRLVVVRRAAELREDRADAQEKLLARVPSDVSVVFIAASLDKRKRSSATFGKYCLTIECPVPDARRLPEWVISFARARGFSLDPAAAELVAAMVDDDPMRVSLELQKVFFYVGDRRQIHEKDVSECLSFTKEEMPWTLADHLLSGRIDHALRSLKRLYEAGTYPAVVLVFVSRQLRRMLDISHLLGRKVPPAAIVKRLALHPYYGYKELEASKRHDPARIGYALEEAVRTESLMKSSSGSDRLLLDSMVFRIWRGLSKGVPALGPSPQTP